jgi:hypothetical protein
MKPFHFLFVVALGARLLGAEEKFAVQQGAGFVDIQYAGGPVATYVYRDLKIHRPYFARLYAPGGVQVTRNFPPKEGTDPTDHAFLHPGLWLAFGDLNGQDFWRNRAVVRQGRFVEEPRATDDQVSFAVANEYLADGHVLANEIARFTWLRRTNSFLLLWDSVFKPADQALAFGDQEEMGLGVRVHTPLTVTKGGVIRNQTGAQNESATRGQITDWIDYFGQVDGRPAGVTLMAHPANFRPSWAHSRDYGLVVLNPFGREALTGGEKSVVRVAPGEELRLRFGVLLHSGAAPDLAAIYQSFAK